MRRVIVPRPHGTTGTRVLARLADVRAIASAAALAVMLGVVLGAGCVAAQEPTAVADVRVKVGASALLGIPLLGIERPLRRPGRSFQWDVLVSPWRSVDGYPFEFVVGTAEWRAYRRETRDGWYAAWHLGAGLFRLRKPEYADTTLYQEGGSLLGGASVGHVWQVRPGWTVDAYLGGGTIQSLYKGYDRLTGRRYDGARLWNVSGEWLPYRVGVAIGIPRGVR